MISPRIQHYLETVDPLELEKLSAPDYFNFSPKGRSYICIDLDALPPEGALSSLNHESTFDKGSDLRCATKLMLEYELEKEIAQRLEDAEATQEHEVKLIIEMRNSGIWKFAAYLIDNQIHCLGADRCARLSIDFDAGRVYYHNVCLDQDLMMLSQASQANFGFLEHVRKEAHRIDTKLVDKPGQPEGTEEHNTSNEPLAYALHKFCSAADELYASDFSSQSALVTLNTYKKRFQDELEKLFAADRPEPPYPFFTKFELGSLGYHKGAYTLKGSLFNLDASCKLQTKNALISALYSLWLRPQEGLSAIFKPARLNFDLVEVLDDPDRFNSLYVELIKEVMGSEHDGMGFTFPLNVGFRIHINEEDCHLDLMEQEMETPAFYTLDAKLSAYSRAQGLLLEHFSKDAQKSTLLLRILASALQCRRAQLIYPSALATLEEYLKLLFYIACDPKEISAKDCRQLFAQLSDKTWLSTMADSKTLAKYLSKLSEFLSLYRMEKSLLPHGFNAQASQLLYLEAEDVGFNKIARIVQNELGLDTDTPTAFQAASAEDARRELESTEKILSYHVEAIWPSQLIITEPDPLNPQEELFPCSKFIKERYLDHLISDAVLNCIATLNSKAFVEYCYVSIHAPQWRYRDQSTECSTCEQPSTPVMIRFKLPIESARLWALYGAAPNLDIIYPAKADSQGLEHAPKKMWPQPLLEDLQINQEVLETCCSQDPELNEFDYQLALLASPEKAPDFIEAKDIAWEVSRRTVKRKMEGNSLERQERQLHEMLELLEPAYPNALQQRDLKEMGELCKEIAVSLRDESFADSPLLLKRIQKLYDTSYGRTIRALTGADREQDPSSQANRCLCFGNLAEYYVYYHHQHPTRPIRLIDSRLGLFLGYYAQMLLIQERFEEVQNIYLQLIEIYPSYPISYLEMASLIDMLEPEAPNKMKLYLDEVQAYLFDSESIALYYHNLGVYHVRSGNTEQAVVCKMSLDAMAAFEHAAHLGHLLKTETGNELAGLEEEQIELLQERYGIPQAPSYTELDHLLNLYYLCLRLGYWFSANCIHANLKQFLPTQIARTLYSHLGITYSEFEVFLGDTGDELFGRH